MYLKKTIPGLQTGDGRRGKAFSSAELAAFYHTTSWRSLRKAYLDQHPLCEGCKPRSVAATVVDHITPMRMGGDGLDWANLQGLCASCHNSKSAKERHIKKP